MCNMNDIIILTLIECSRQNTKRSKYNDIFKGQKQQKRPTNRQTDMDYNHRHQLHSNKIMNYKSHAW